MAALNGFKCLMLCNVNVSITARLKMKPLTDNKDKCLLFFRFSSLSFASILHSSVFNTVVLG